MNVVLRDRNICTPYHAVDISTSMYSALPFNRRSCNGSEWDLSEPIFDVVGQPVQGQGNVSIEIHDVTIGSGKLSCHSVTVTLSTQHHIHISLA
jgi:hypothetical protein